MTTPPPASSTPGTPDETGAVRNRKKRAALLPLWLLLGLLALIALALILYYALRGDNKKTATPVAVPVATSAAPADVTTGVAIPADTAVPASPADTAVPATPVDTALPTAPATAAAPAATTAAPAPSATTVPAGNLVGGAGKTPMPATGKDAEPGDTGTVLFAENKSDIDDQGKAVIAAAAANLKAAMATKVTVTGYTDKVAGTPVNDPLSQARADKVAAMLRADLGPGVTVTTAAKGEADPAATNDTAAGRAQNRRAVISRVS